MLVHAPMKCKSFTIFLMVSHSPASSVCADQAPMLNRGDAVGWNDWRELPIDQQLGWQIPISMMINITQLRRFQPVITTAEYLQYAGLSPTSETTSGYWNRSAYYHSPDLLVSHSDNTFGKPTLFVIENAWYDPEGVTRVDTIPETMKRRGGWVAGNMSAVQASHWESREDDAAQSLLRSLLLDKNVVEWDEAQSAVRALAVQMPESVGVSSPDFDSDEFVEDVLNRNGWEVLYTFQGASVFKYLFLGTLFSDLDGIAQGWTLSSMLLCPCDRLHRGPVYVALSRTIII